MLSTIFTIWAAIKTRTLQTISVFGKIRRSNEENNKKRCNMIRPVKMKFKNNLNLEIWQAEKCLGTKCYDCMFRTCKHKIITPVHYVKSFKYYVRNFTMFFTL